MSKCKEQTEVWSRVCGFFRPVKQWNAGKRQEFKDRVNYHVKGDENGKKAEPTS
jgi:ribonucleoside-triphosphate reductase